MEPARHEWAPLQSPAPPDVGVRRIADGVTQWRWANWMPRSVPNGILIAARTFDDHAGISRVWNLSCVAAEVVRPATPRHRSRQPDQAPECRRPRSARVCQAPADLRTKRAGAREGLGRPPWNAIGCSNSCAVLASRLAPRPR